MKPLSVMKKMILLAVMTAALAGAAVQKASAGVVVGASVGVPYPSGYCAPAYNPGYYNPGYYNYGYARPYYGYGYNYCPPPAAYVQPPVVYGPSFYVAPPAFRFGFGHFGHFDHFGHGHFSHHGHW